MAYIMSDSTKKELDEKIVTAIALTKSFHDDVKDNGFEGYALDFDIILNAINSIQYEVDTRVLED